MHTYLGRYVRIILENQIRLLAPRLQTHGAGPRIFFLIYMKNANKIFYFTCTFPAVARQ